MLYSRSLLVICFIYGSVYFGEGNGNPLQCSCLENPRDGGALWAALYGVAQSRTRLKRLSSSSSSSSSVYEGLSWWLSDKKYACQAGDIETWVQSLSREDPLEEEMATCSNILAWEMSWTKVPGGLQPMGL